MALKEKFIVVPFRKAGRGGAVPGEMRQASSEDAAERLALAISKHQLGAAAIAVLVDDETGEMTAPRLIAEFGTVVDLITDVAA